MSFRRIPWLEDGMHNGAASLSGRRWSQCWLNSKRSGFRTGCPLRWSSSRRVPWAISVSKRKPCGLRVLKCCWGRRRPWLPVHTPSWSAPLWSTQAPRPRAPAISSSSISSNSNSNSNWAIYGGPRRSVPLSLQRRIINSSWSRPAPSRTQRALRPPGRSTHRL